ncbi:MAG TPA: type II secretion system F family protein [Verrucomicrobiales bacterium]|nr:type II secretion system F family protein [Verrucomicrobiales bacterium]
MASFNYIALDSQGQETTGQISAGTDAEAITLLRGQGLYPTKVLEDGKGSIGGKKKAVKARARARSSRRGGRVNNKTLMIFTRQLATLIDSGLPLLRGLTVLAKQEPNPVLKRTIKTLEESVQGGSTFSESLAAHPKIFNKLYINMVKAGELGGVLEVVLIRLAEYQEKAQKLKNKIVSAMVYPSIVLFIAVSIMIFLLAVIVPSFEKIFADMLQGKPLPWLTQQVVGLSRSVKEHIFLILGGVIVFFILFRLFAATKFGRRFIDSLKLRLPVFGNVQRKSAISRFARTLGTLVTSGVPILQALNITRDTAGNVIISNAIDKVHASVKEGESIVQPLEASKVFPPMVISMVDVGEETGQLPEMLLKIADVYDDEVDNAVAALTSLLEPIMIVILALVVGTIVLALFLPLVEIIKNLQAGA